MQKILNLLVPIAIYGSTVLEVALPTQQLVKPLYICATTTESSDYIEKLREILAFDIQQGGAIQVAPITTQLVPFPFQKTRWSAFQYLLVMQLTNKNLSLSLIDVEKETAKHYSPICLTEDVNVDRCAIHRFSDQLHQELFGIQGIASQRILYTQRMPNPTGKGLPWISEIWISDYDGANASPLTHTNGYCLSPGFLPTAKGETEFFYVFYDEGQSKIYYAPLSKPQCAKSLIFMRGNQLLPAISKAGDQIAFIADLTGRPDLFLQSIDANSKVVGKPKQLYSAPRATQASPTFHPNGKQLAFVSDKDGTPRIYLLDIAASQAKPKLLTKKYRDNSSPAWSPDGKKIAYAAKVDGVRQICLFDCATELETVITTDPETKENPSWAPNSIHLLYNTENTTCELYLFNTETLQSTQISKGPGQKRFGAWNMR